MRILSPEPGEADLAARYAYPPDGTWLRANMVASLDGAAQRDERSGGLGNAADRHLFLLLRGLADAVIIGAQTVRAEGYGPVRRSEGWDAVRDRNSPAPPIAIVSRSLDLDFGAPIFTEAEVPTMVLAPACADPARVEAAREHADVIIAGQDSLDFSVAVRELAERGHRRLLCEGGPSVLGQVVAAGLLDELCLTLSPMLLGGNPTRILDGPPVPVPPELKLAHALQDEDFLFLRYTRNR
ncbi:5-amino-6-(5-phosphoribosylamino)uracil reductase [Actinomadura meyerae]|jgi:riboflavin biosynthesis pyrimidine reductase|uniref:5-amino-6-(5-phosphoribosylamino)uracil reductase n=1 Tax=Actinomadura meyerae TaxID=240840 RepID=A0A239NB77_9ACTN|nr:pyrimidine reductase family protein [Actinomadura meyerae]SNT51752.1 5-amino-6-(5-phosphoribosylamino)uracil reductase [Actinomadura meyerae]